MADQTSKGDIQLNRSLLVGGGVLVTLGGMLGFTGMALLASALISATRQWVDQLEQPPSEIARRRWEQTKAAATAGAAALRTGRPSAAFSRSQPGMAICSFGRTVAGSADLSPKGG